MILIAEKLSLVILTFALSQAFAVTENSNFCPPLHSHQDKHSPAAEELVYQLIARYPHDVKAFTQGLVFYQDRLFESTGILGHSAVRILDLGSGEILKTSQLPDIYFGEGLSVYNHQLLQMSWKTGKVFFFHPETLKLISTRHLDKEVWGSTVINDTLVISDGSSKLLYIDPVTLNIKTLISVTMQKQEIKGLNELEYAHGYLYANIWPTPCIIQIDPINGQVTGWLNLAGLVPDATQYHLPDNAVLNGIAFSRQKNHFFVTGKYWPFIYEIKIQSNEK